MSYDLDTIREISILSIAQKLNIQVKRNKALCYNGHDNKTPSLSFNEKKGVYKCFGCGEAGDSIALVGNVLNLDFKGSCIWISQAFNLLPVRNYHLPKISRVKQQSTLVDKVTYRANPEIYQWLISRVSLSNESRSYLKSRGFQDKIIDELQIRDYSPSSNLLRDLLRTWPTQMLIECGLVKAVDQLNVKLIWWDKTIIFPFLNINSEIMYLQGRRLEKNGPKYLNLTGVESIMYNTQVINKLSEGDRIFICEGITDTITAIQNNLPCLGVLGASGFKEKWINDLIDFQVFVIPDSDHGGEVFFNDVRTKLEGAGKTVSRVDLGGAPDLNDYFNGNK